MNEPGAPPPLDVHHVELYVSDLDARTAEWVAQYGFAVVGTACSPGRGARSTALRQGEILLVLTQGRAEEHPASAYVRRHGDGVADIALRTDDARATCALAVRGGARLLSGPVDHASGGAAVTAVIAGFGDLVHTLVEPRPGDEHGLPPGFTPVPGAPRPRTVSGPAAPGLVRIDHFALCVRAGELDSTVARYHRALGLTETFEEHIRVGGQAMLSKAVQSRCGALTLTVIAPDPSAGPGQIDDFLARHDGPGVQHIAFTTGDAVATVAALTGAGVAFLNAPGAYYDLLEQRLAPARHSLAALRASNLLMDEDHAGQLFQIFTRSTHPRRTLFFEVIERMGATTFGSANVRSLYEAVEAEHRVAEGTPS